MSRENVVGEVPRLKRAHELPDLFGWQTDCIVRVCDGAGQMIDEALAADVPALDTSTPCVSSSCSAGGAPVIEYLPPGQPCGGGTGVCDGMGSCE